MISEQIKRQAIDMKRRGETTTFIAKKLGISRKSVYRYWLGANNIIHELTQKGEDARTIQHAIYTPPTYPKRESPKRKQTAEFQARLAELCERNEMLRKKYRWSKQRLTNVQIYEVLCEDGFEISLSTVNLELAKLRKPSKNPEVYIKQFYEYGKRLEFDFGEVKLDCGEGIKTYHMAVFCAPASNFRWCFLYDNQKQSVFLDSHVQFFKLIGGVWEEIVYDNMKNVVQSFLGKSGKKLNPELERLAAYYGFKIKTTNAYAGNEKGSVERSVEVLRNKIFALHDTFSSFETARKHVDITCKKLAKSSGIEIERDFLHPAPPPYELAQFCEASVSKYGLISVDGNRYSVPETLVNKRVTVKKYYDEIRVYFDFAEVARHKRSSAKGEDIIDIMHYLSAFEKKPGALGGSLALKSVPKLKDIFDNKFADNPRKFIEILRKNAGLTLDEIIEILEQTDKREIEAKTLIKSDLSIETQTDNLLQTYAKLAKGGVENDDDRAV